MNHNYILDDEKRPVKVSNIEWAIWFEVYENRKVGYDETKFHRISTVFIGIDHQFGEGPPMLFETLVDEKKTVIADYKGRLYPRHEDIEQYRYASWDDAETGHKAVLRKYQKWERENDKAIRGHMDR